MSTTDYIGGIHYENNLVSFVQTAEGRLRKEGTSWIYEYNLTDHLGNVRVSFDKNPSTGVARLIQKDDYYPFGLTFNHPNVAGDNKYLYNGKELQQETDWYDYGARMYDPTIARWYGVDKSAESYVNQSPYHYAGNNPVIFVDYDGNDYGVSVNHDSKTITVHARYLANDKNIGAVNKAIRFFNGQSGNKVFVEGGKQGIKSGTAKAYSVNFNLTSDVANGDKAITDPSSGVQVSSVSQGDFAVSNDGSGVLNSVNSVPDGTLPTIDGKKQLGSASDNIVNVEESAMGTNTTTHEIGHTLGLDHSGGLMSPTGGSSLNVRHVSEILAGVGIGGDNTSRNAESSVGNGTLLGSGGSNTVGSGTVMSKSKYERLVRRAEKRNEEN